jgi:hypothetical protein
VNQLPTRWRMPRYREGKPTPGRVSQRSLERVGAVRRRLRTAIRPPTRPNTHGAPARATRSSAYAGPWQQQRGRPSNPPEGGELALAHDHPSLREQQGGALWCCAPGHPPSGSSSDSGAAAAEAATTARERFGSSSGGGPRTHRRAVRWRLRTTIRPSGSSSTSPKDAGANCRSVRTEAPLPTPLAAAATAT